MHLRLRYLFLFLSVLIVFTLNLKTSVAQLPIQNAIDRLIADQMATQHIPGLALAVTQGDKILYTKEYGTQFHYFNSNYAILARVVEVVSQQPFSE